ncbi:MAG: hypothetical protein V4569_05175, partial [Pseudomonadota bacterium]
TLIKSTADLNSNDDMELTSGVVESLKLTAESTGEAQPGKKDKNTKVTIGSHRANKPIENTSADTAVSAAIIVGIENNSSQALVEGGAELDSMRALRLLSGVTYPFLTRPDEFVPVSAGELSDKITSEGFDFVNTYLDGTGGLKSLFNTWARATTEADKLAIAGSINVLVFNNVAESIVHSGAKINQDPFYRPDPSFYTDPDNYDPANNDNDQTQPGGHSSNANNVDEHVVSIEAINYMQFLNLTGTFSFHLPSASLDPASLLANGGDVDPSFELSPSGATSKRGGVGGAIFVQVLNNTTKAEVESGVELYSGTQSGLNVKAEEAIMGFAFSQAGANAGKLAVGGTFSYFEQNSDTLAHLDAGSTIEGGRVDVYAGTLETQINWAGGVAQSKAIGAGVAVAVNNTDRKTRAVIGELSDSAGTGAEGPMTIDIEGAVTSRASVAGGIYAFTVAGAVTNTTPDKDAQKQTQTNKQQQAGTGVAIAAAASVNLVTDVTQASLSDAIVTADAVDMRANNQNRIVSATGGLAFTKASSGPGGSSTQKNNAVALAGALSDNVVNATTDAFVRDATITLSDVPLEDFVVESAKRRFSVTADSAGDIWALAAGGAGALADGGNAVVLAGSVALNSITGHTRAAVIDTDVDLLDGDALIHAGDQSSIFTIAGALALGIAKGSQSSGGQAVAAGIALAFNDIQTDTEALVDDSSFIWADGASGGLTIEAASTGEIKAFTVAGAVAVGLAKQGTGFAVAGAGSGSLNEIDADTTATMHRSTVDAGDAVAVTATNSAEIIAGAGAVAVAFASSG